MYDVKPPTDNLYKFMALSGLVVLVSAFAFPWRMADDLAMRTISTEQQAFVYAAEMQHLLHDAEAKEKVGVVPTPADQPYTTATIKSVDEFLKGLAIEHKELRPTRIKYLEYAFEEQRLDNLKSKVSSLKCIALFASMFGGGLMIVGFAMWHIRVQLFQDQILRKAAETKDDSSPDV